MGAKFLKRRKNSRSWYFYRAVPLDLVAKLGRRHWEESLGTTDEREAERLARKRAVETDEEIERLRAPPPPDLIEIAEAKLAELPTHERAEGQHEKYDRAGRAAMIAAVVSAIEAKDRVLGGLGLELP